MAVPDDIRAGRAQGSGMVARVNNEISKTQSIRWQRVAHRDCPVPLSLRIWDQHEQAIRVVPGEQTWPEMQKHGEGR